MLTSHCNFNLSWVKETKQPHKKFKVDWFGGGYIPIYPPSLRLCSLRHSRADDFCGMPSHGPLNPLC